MLFVKFSHTFYVGLLETQTVIQDYVDTEADFVEPNSFANEKDPLIFEQDFNQQVEDLDEEVGIGYDDDGDDDDETENEDSQDVDEIEENLMTTEEAAMIRLLDDVDSATSNPFDLPTTSTNAYNRESKQAKTAKTLTNTFQRTTGTSKKNKEKETTLVVLKSVDTNSKLPAKQPLTDLTSVRSASKEPTFAQPNLTQFIVTQQSSTLNSMPSTSTQLTTTQSTASIQATLQPVSALQASSQPTSKTRGRPKGSKNKNTLARAEATIKKISSIFFYLC